MTATQFYADFVSGLLDLRGEGIITSEQLDRIIRETAPVLRDTLSAALRDESEYYDEGRYEPDVEHDFHAEDDAAFDRMEDEYKQVMSSES